jgi:hypothetical protein
MSANTDIDIFDALSRVLTGINDEKLALKIAIGFDAAILFGASKGLEGIGFPSSDPKVIKEMYDNKVSSIK